MICERCKDQGTIPIPGREGVVARCPACKGASFMQALEMKYTRRSRRAKVIVFACVLLILLGIGVQAL